jgi:hypothetical protein
MYDVQIGPAELTRREVAFGHELARVGHITKIGTQIPFCRTFAQVLEAADASVAIAARRDNRPAPVRDLLTANLGERPPGFVVRPAQASARAGHAKASVQ